MTKSASTPVETSLDAGLSAIQRGDYQEAAACCVPWLSPGIKQAQYQMGVMAADGLGQIKDLASAKEWLRRAADQGFAPAKRRLEQLQNPPSRVAWQMNSVTESGRQVTAAVGIKSRTSPGFRSWSPKHGVCAGMSEGQRNCRQRQKPRPPRQMTVNSLRNGKLRGV